MAKNAIYNIIYKMLNILFPLITSVYVARILMAESIGRVSAAQNMASYFTLAASMGIPTYGVKLIAQYEMKSQESSKAFAELFTINAIFSLACSSVYYTVVLVSPYFNGKEDLYCITGLNILFNIINVDWFYQGVQKYGYIAARSLIIKCISLICLIGFVHSEGDYIIYALISTGATVGNYLFNILRIKHYIVAFVSPLGLAKHLKQVFLLFAASIAAEVYVLADITMLDHMCDSKTVGYYTMSMKIIRLIRSLVVAVSAVFLPQMSYYFHNERKDSFYKLADKGLHILIAMALPATVGLLLVANDAILVLYGSEFNQSIIATRILAVSIMTVALSNYIGMQILVTIGQEKITTISTICGACINVILNYMLIRNIQHIGAAIASVITEGTVMVIQIILSKKYIHLHFRLRKPVVSAIIMAITVLLINHLRIGISVRLLLSCFCGITIYGVLMVIQKDDFAVTAVNKVFNKKNKYHSL